MDRDYYMSDEEWDDAAKYIHFVNGKQRRIVRQEYVEQSRTVPLPVNPHYSDSRYSRGGERLVFGVKDYPGGHWNYSDRLWQRDYEKHEAAWAKTKASRNTPNSANWFELYLSEYHGRPVHLFGIMACVNVSNGYPLQIFGYAFKDGKDE